MRVRGKRLGWNEVLSTQQLWDLDPYEEESDDLEGELVRKMIPATSYHPAFEQVLIGGHEADPASIEVWDETLNAFCPTGPGGGVDPTCSPGEGGGGKGAGGKAIAAEEDTPPPPGDAYQPNPEPAHGKVAEHARVGVPANSVPPPPPIGRLPNLTPHERAVESEFADRYEANPDGMARDYREIAISETKHGEPVTFATDNAKVLSPHWASDEMSLEQRSQNRAQLNTPLHQTANAIAKRAFVQHLDTLRPGDSITVTVGGCGAGKGYCLDKVPEVQAIKNSSKVVWDSAGDQNATENPWIQREAEARGLNVNYVYVHADPETQWAHPETQWAHPERGVVQRANNPKDGRMVDAEVFADSYAYGARNHQTFAEANAGNPRARFFYIESGTPPMRSESMPTKALEVNRDRLASFARSTVERRPEIPPHIRRGALAGSRIWRD